MRHDRGIEQRSNGRRFGCLQCLRRRWLARPKMQREDLDGSACYADVATEHHTCGARGHLHEQHNRLAEQLTALCTPMLKPCTLAHRRQ